MFAGAGLISWNTVFSFPREHWLERHLLLTTLPTLAKEWRVTFELKPMGYNYNSYANVLHMTTSANNKNIVGYQTPALWIHGSRGVYIGTALNGKADDGKLFKTKKPPIDEWTRVEISQVKHGSKYIFSLVIKGEKLWSVENTNPRQFSNVRVYASRGVAQDGYIRKLKIENMTPGERK